MARTTVAESGRRNNHGWICALRECACRALPAISPSPCEARAARGWRPNRPGSASSPPPALHSEQKRGSPQDEFRWVCPDAPAQEQPHPRPAIESRIRCRGCAGLRGRSDPTPGPALASQPDPAEESREPSSRPGRCPLPPCRRRISIRDKSLRRRRSIVAGSHGPLVRQ